MPVANKERERIERRFAEKEKEKPGVEMERDDDVVAVERDAKNIGNVGSFLPIDAQGFVSDAMFFFVGGKGSNASKVRSLRGENYPFIFTQEEADDRRSSAALKRKLSKVADIRESAVWQILENPSLYSVYSKALKKFFEIYMTTLRKGTINYEDFKSTLYKLDMEVCNPLSASFAGKKLIFENNRHDLLSIDIPEGSSDSSFLRFSSIMAAFLCSLFAKKGVVVDVSGRTPEEVYSLLVSYSLYPEFNDISSLIPELDDKEFTDYFSGRDNTARNEKSRGSRRGGNMGNRTSVSTAGKRAIDGPLLTDPHEGNSIADEIFASGAVGKFFYFSPRKSVDFWEISETDEGYHNRLEAMNLPSDADVERVKARVYPEEASFVLGKGIRNAQSMALRKKSVEIRSDSIDPENSWNEDAQALRVQCNRTHGAYIYPIYFSSRAAAEKAWQNLKSQNRDKVWQKIRVKDPDGTYHTEDFLVSLFPRAAQSEMSKTAWSGAFLKLKTDIGDGYIPASVLNENHTKPIGVPYDEELEK